MSNKNLFDLDLQVNKVSAISSNTTTGTCGTYCSCCSCAPVVNGVQANVITPNYPTC